MTNHVDRFYAAVSVLVGDGHIKQRLIRAYADNLADIDDDELPLTLQQTFLDLRRRMRRVQPANGEGRICATVRKMSAREANTCAKLVVELFSELRRHRDGAGAPSPESMSMAGDGEARVPAFIAKSV